LLRSVNIGQTGTEGSHHLQASHLTSKATKTTTATTLGYILASGLDTRDIYRIEPLMTAPEISRDRRYRRWDPEGAIRKQRDVVRAGMKEKRREVAVVDELRAGCLWRPRELKRWTTVRRAFPKPTLKRL
jgi:hypothetical protein